MESPSGQLLLGGLDVLPQLEQAERQATAAAPLLLVSRRLQLGLLPGLVGGDQFRRQAQDLAPGEGRQLSTHGQDPVGAGLGHVELAAAGQGPHEGGVAPAPGAQPEGRSGRGQVEVEPLRGCVEPVGEETDEPCGRRAEHPRWGISGHSSRCR